MNSNKETQELAVDFMFIDLQTCGRCLGTQDALAAAVAATRPALEAVGVDLKVSKILVESEEHAATLKFQSSPTIRIGGRDVAGALSESNCGDCGDVCGKDTDCRVWSWRGKEYNAAPVGLLVEAILQQVISSDDNAAPNSSYVVPDNLKQFFVGKRKQIRPAAANTAASPCCNPAESTNCC